MNAIAKPPRKQREHSPCPLNFEMPVTAQDKIDLLTTEVDRLRTLLHFGAPVQALLERWEVETLAFERSGNRVAARALRKRANELRAVLG